MKKQTVIKVLVAALLLSSILLSSLLGVSKAEYFKKLSKSLDFEVKPDLMLEYYLYDSLTTTSNETGLTPEHGAYKNAESFAQKIVIGRHADKTLQNTAGSTNTSKIYYGKDIVYQIKIPVDETGYYTLNFTSEFIKGDAPTIRDTYMEQDFYSVSYREAVGCEVLNSENTNSYQDLSFGTPKALDLAARVFDNQVFYEKQGYTADSAFQWKTLTPGRSENVRLSFKVNKEDVENGYVIWMWELTGLRGNQEFTFVCESLDVEKIMELDGTMSKRESDAPYFMLPKTTVTNNQIRILNKSVLLDSQGAPTSGNDARRGSNTPGKTAYSDGRGTYVTEATENSIGMRFETLNSGVLVQNGKQDWYYSNPVSFQVPLKNIKFDTTYKVTFDFSVARQGGAAPSNAETSNKIGGNQDNMWDYVDFSRILNRIDTSAEHNTATNIKVKQDNGTDGVFYSYLHDNVGAINTTDDIATVGSHNFNVSRIVVAEHNAAAKKIKYAYKEYQDEALTSYTDIMKYCGTEYSGKLNNHDYLDLVTSTTVNDTYSIDYFNNHGSGFDSTDMRNHFNAVQHTEVNGQVAINWLTFYNTTFSFNIPESENGEVDIDNLNWVWAINLLEYDCFYNIRIDNIRIQEVVEYSSKVEHNGVQIADKQTDVTIDAFYYGQNVTGADTSVFNNFKGYNNIGQNYDVRRDDDGRYFAVGNIFAPTFDAKRFSAKASENGDRDDDYTIRISGWAVLKGGTSKYMFSIDGGFTWYDMAFEGTSDTSIFGEALQGIHQNTYRQSYNYDSGITHDFEFVEKDAMNDSFDNFSLVADLKSFKDRSNIDIIIAAVPFENENLRCEILRIINYNVANTYVSKLDTISSDIVSGSAGTIKVTNEKMSLNNSVSGTSNTFTAHHYPVYEKGSFDNKFANNGGGGALGTQNALIHSEKIDYSKLKTTYSDIPVKTTLTLNGAILCGGGVYAYEYSIDGGKSWHPCTYTMSGFVEGTDYVLGSTLNKPFEKLMYKFLTRHTGNKTSYLLSNSGNFSKNAIQIDLSNYKGKVVDVIVAAKPNYVYNTNSRYSGDARLADIHLPIAKVDNVAVYGETGTFYTRINSLTFDGRVIEPDYFDLGGKPLNRVTKSTDGSVVPQWNLGYTADNAEEFSYTIFEPNNVNVVNSRLYNNDINEVQMGSKVVIKGYTVINGATHNNEYMFTLDGGDTWSNIDLKANVAPTDDIKNYSKLSDTSFANFNYANYYDDSTGNLTFEIPVIPDLPEGAIRTLTVVAKNAEGNTVPVLNIKIKISNVPWGTYDIKYSTSSNFAIEHEAFSYVDDSGITHNDYEGSKLSLPSMYFEYGKHIEVSYSVKGNVQGQPRLIITTEMLSDKEKPKPVVQGKNFYVTIPIKYINLEKDSIGTVDLNGLREWGNPYLQGDKNDYKDALPVGNYKVWLVDDDSNILGHDTSGPDFVMDPFKAAASRMLTEPVTIKVIDPNKPDFSIMSHTGTINNGQNQQANERNDNTRIGIDKTTFVQGERIYFHIQLDYSFRHIMLMKADLPITDVANEPTKGNYDMELYGKTWRYAVDGYTNGNDFLDTTGLEPGHYKLYYLMGRDLQAAIRGDIFYHAGDLSFKDYETSSKLLAAIDIIILPKGATQTLTVTYTKYDGTTATITESFPMSGKALAIEEHNYKLLTKYHSGIDFEQTITGTQPNTTFEFTVTTNFNAESDDIKKYFEDRFTCKVLQKSVTVVS